MVLLVGMGCSDYLEWVMLINWVVVVDWLVLEVLLSIYDGIEIRLYIGGFVVMIGDGIVGYCDWLYIGVVFM